MKSGFVAIIGPPNVGKSTFLNQALGFKLAITSDKPQTTRHRLLGVHNLPQAQIVFLDTPGIHAAKGALNRRMVATAEEALGEVDAVLFMAEITAKGMERAQALAPRLARVGSPVILALNKIDLLPKKEALLPLLARAAQWGAWKAMVPLSAQTGDGVDELLKELTQALPEGPALFPPEVITDLPMRFLASELIREKVFRLTGQEVPYSTAVTVDQYLEPEEPERPVAITATIHVERQGHKGIIIGKGGAMVKKIGTQARLDLEKLIGQPVFLDLLVRVEPKWSRQEQGLKKMGY
ncbi:MAG: GTPase Era [Proteobacteria bacterium]|nr:GTPase Era [Pseudomonadota bacterium]MBU1452777.1 GTPase Era [Pseudomonadota bacterium]MBU2469090.1 GTPase Era [Pseudomonadota bacterium]MBU2519443.1 GTPase Era [Pseudomonadota bacterium]